MASRRLDTVTGPMGQLHVRQRGWRTWVRVAWWLLLLPLALACWAATQHGPRQLAGWGLAGLALIAWIGSATGSGDQTPTAADDQKVQTITAPVSTYSPTPPPTTTISTPAVVPTTLPSVTAPPPTPVAVAPVVPPPPLPAPAVTRTTAAPPLVPTTEPPAAAESFDNCTDMRKTYPHGVGIPGSVDHTSGSAPVTTYKKSAALYEANSGSDRDGDGIACEQ